MKVALWSDLPSRLCSGLVLGLVGFFTIFFGGMFLLFAVAFLVFIMHYELAKMQSPLSMRAPKYSSIVALTTILLLNYSPNWIIFLIVLTISLACQYFFMRTQKLAGVVYSMIIILGSFYFLELRSNFGLLFLVWILCIVILTDTFGYFGGRLIGGPKFFVSISPNKTWAGILSGWLVRWFVLTFLQN